MEWLVRPASEGDLSALAKVEAATLEDPWNETMLRREMEAPGAFQLLALTGPPRPPLPLGYAAFRLVAGEAELLRIGVIPESRRRGLGRHLLRQGLDRLEAAGAQLCHLEVRRRNVAAIRFYHQEGFAIVGERRRYYADGEDALLMLRELPRL